MGKAYDHMAEMAKYLHFRPGQSAEEWITRHLQPVPVQNQPQPVEKVSPEQVRQAQEQYQAEWERQFVETMMGASAGAKTYRESAWQGVDWAKEATVSTSSSQTFQSAASDGKYWYPDLDKPPYGTSPLASFETRKVGPLHKYNKYTKPDGTVVFALVLEKPYN